MIIHQNQKPRHLTAIFVFLASVSLIVSGCAGIVSAAPSLQATARPIQPVQQPTAIPTAYNACLIPDDHPTTQHIVAADIDYAAHVVTVAQRIEFVNRTGVDLSQLMLIVEATQWRGAFALQNISQENITLPYHLEDKRLLIDLPEPLRPECEAVIELNFTLSVPQIGNGVWARRGFFSYTPQQMNLGHWLPTVAAYYTGGWDSRESFFIGEQQLLEPADWLVTVNLLGNGTDVLIAGPGVMTQLTADRWRFEHRNSRDFTISLSHQFTVDQIETPGGTVVELYTLSATDVNGAAFTALDAAASSLMLYSELFGAYQHPRLVLVEGDFPDGMEFSGLSFVGSNWFANYPGTPASYLVLITVHEVSHQWWYDAVGNDPAYDPWLDEALATYSEYIFLEAYFPDLRDWWWSFRVNSFSPSGRVNSDIYQFDNNRSYINTVYLNGARMLHEIRGALGVDAFYDLLANYATAGNGQIATPELFWSQLTPEQLNAVEAIRRRYMDR